MKAVFFFLCAVAFAQEGVDVMEFGSQIETKSASGRADVKRVRACYLGLAGRSDHEHPHRLIPEKPGAVALMGSSGGVFLLGVAGARGASLFAEIPEGARWVEFSAPGVSLRQPYVLVEGESLSPFMDKLAVLKAGGNPARAVRVRAMPVVDESSLARQLVALAGRMVPSVFANHSRARGSVQGHLQALQACREVSDLKLRQMVDDEIAKFAAAR